MTLLGLYCYLSQNRLFQTVTLQFKYRVPPKVLCPLYAMTKMTYFGTVFSKTTQPITLKLQHYVCYKLKDVTLAFCSD